jgi:hypothetical protein
MKAQLVAGGRRNILFALLIAFALTIAASSLVFGEGGTTPEPPVQTYPEGTDSMPIDTTGTQTPGGIQSVSTPCLSFFEIVLVVFQVI